MLQFPKVYLQVGIFFFSVAEEIFGNKEDNLTIIHMLLNRVTGTETMDIQHYRSQPIKNV